MRNMAISRFPRTWVVYHAIATSSQYGWSRHVIKFVATKRVAQIRASHARIINDLPARALKHHPTVIDDDAAINDAKRLCDIVIGNQDALAKFDFQPHNLALEILD